MLAAGIWLLYQQLFVWPATYGLIMMMTGLLIAIGALWLTVDIILPIFLGERSAPFLKAADNAIAKFNVALGAVLRSIKFALGRLVRTIVWLMGLCGVLAAFACWAFQLYQWLKYGTWIEAPISEFIKLGITGWLGIDQILLWAFQINIGFPLLFAGFWIMALSMMDDR